MYSPLGSHTADPSIARVVFGVVCRVKLPKLPMKLCIGGAGGIRRVVVAAMGWVRDDCRIVSDVLTAGGSVRDECGNVSTRVRSSCCVRDNCRPVSDIRTSWVDVRDG